MPQTERDVCPDLRVSVLLSLMGRVQTLRPPELRRPVSVHPFWGVCHKHPDHGKPRPRGAGPPSSHRCGGGANRGGAAAPLRGFLVDDHEIVRRGAGSLLDDEDGIEVVGEAGTAAQAMARVPVLEPDVVVLDVRLPDGDGVTVCRDIRSMLPDTRMLMLTSYSDDEALYGAVMAGASGYILKQIHGTDLVGAVRTVAQGRSLLDPESTTRMLKRLREEAGRKDPLSELTEQERRILQLIGEGQTMREIGARMYSAEKTVKNYVSRVLAKLGMARRTLAAAYAVRLSMDQTG